MKVAVRYFSRSGNTKLAAEAIARAANVKAVSVDAGDAALQEPVDVLFIGGALYAYGIDEHLKTYIASLNRANVKRAVVFSTSWISKHAIALIRDGLEKQGIPVADDTLYFRGKPGEKQQQEAESFARKYFM
jgi:flavodoxin